MSQTANLQMTVPKPFDFDLIVRSHGWYTLPTFQYDADNRSLHFIAAAPWGPCAIQVSNRSPGMLRIRASSVPDPASRAWIRSTVRRVFSLDQDLTPFYTLCQNDPSLRWVARRGAGRILRSNTVWEDLLKVLCTTNCSWALTTKMVERLVEHAGPRTSGEARGFPQPKDLNGKSELWFRDKIRAGYRSPFFVRLVQRILAGELDPESWALPEADPDQVEAEIRSIHGAGPYAVEQLHRLLGRFDGLALDSWCRSVYAERYHEGRRIKDTTIRRRYAKYGEWAGLAMWLDLTSGWHEEA